MTPIYRSASNVFAQDERILLINKLFSRLSLPVQLYEYEDAINTVSCLTNLFNKIELRKLSGTISSDKQLKEQLLEEDRYFQQFIESLYNLYTEAESAQITRTYEAHHERY